MSEQDGFVAGFRGALRAVFADRSAVLTLIGAAVLYSAFYPAPYHREIAFGLPVVAADLDRSGMSRAVVRRLLAVRAVRLAEEVSSAREAEARVRAGRVDAAVVILPDFERDILRGRQGRVALFGRGAILGRGGPALGGLSDAVASFGREAVVAQARLIGPPAPPPVQLVRRPLFNTREGYGSAIVPAVAVLIVHQTLVMGIGLLAGARRERGERLAASWRQLLGVAAAFGTIGISSLLYYSGFVFWVQDYPRAGNLGGLLTAGASFIAATVALALLLGSFFTTRERSFQAVALTSLTLFFLANISWPAAASPAALTWMVKLLPTTAGIGALVKASQSGASAREVAPELANRVALALLYGSVATWRYRRLDPSHDAAPAVGGHRA
jgi:ABC-2 type transport system permease protein